MTGSQLSTPQPQTVGKFTNEAAARAARQKLLAANFSAEQVYLEEQPITTDNPMEDTQAGSGLKGGAMAGGLLGGACGLFFALAAVKFSAVELVRTSDATMWFIGLAIAGGAIGALAFGLMGGLSGASAPKETQNSSDSPLPEKQYLLMIQGTQEQHQQANDILQG